MNLFAFRQNRTHVKFLNIFVQLHNTLYANYLAEKTDTNYIDNEYCVVVNWKITSTAAK